MRHHTTIHCQLPFLYKKQLSSYLSCQKCTNGETKKSSKINYNRQYTDTGYAQSILNFQTRKSKTAATINYMQQHNAELNINTKNNQKQFGHVIQEFTTPTQKTTFESFVTPSLLGFS